MNPDLKASIAEEVVEELMEEGTEAFRSVLEKLFNVTMRIERSDYLGAEPYERSDTR